MPEKNYRNSIQDERLKVLEKSHRFINEELGTVKVDIAGIKATQKIILAFVMMIFAGLVGLFIK